MILNKIVFATILIDSINQSINQSIKVNLLNFLTDYSRASHLWKTQQEHSGKPYVQSYRPLSILRHTLLATVSHQTLFHLTSLSFYWNCAAFLGFFWVSKMIFIFSAYWNLGNSSMKAWWRPSACLISTRNKYCTVTTTRDDRALFPAKLPHLNGNVQWVTFPTYFSLFDGMGDGWEELVMDGKWMGFSQMGGMGVFCNR